MLNIKVYEDALFKQVLKRNNYKDLSNATYNEQEARFHFFGKAITTISQNPSIGVNLLSDREKEEFNRTLNDILKVDSSIKKTKSEIGESFIKKLFIFANNPNSTEELVYILALHLGSERNTNKFSLIMLKNNIVTLISDNRKREEKLITYKSPER